jgi:hypothetical protein
MVIMSLPISFIWDVLPEASRGLVRTLVVLFVSCGFLFQACSERVESFYPSLADAIKAGEITRGWIPDMLPGSSHAIHIIYAAESSKTWCAFDFSPSDSQRLRENLTRVDELPLQLADIRGPDVSWWPDSLRGEVDVRKLRRQGFALYVVSEQGVPSGNKLSLFAIDWAKGHGLFYRSAG